MKIKLLALLVIGIATGASLFYAPQSRAVDIFPSCTSQNSGQCDLIKQNDLDYRNSNNRVWGITQVILGLLSAVAVIMIIIGGIKYVTSQGDSSAVASAKNTILYSVVGLVVAISAAIIVGFITNQFG